MTRAGPARVSRSSSATGVSEKPQGRAHRQRPIDSAGLWGGRERRSGTVRMSATSDSATRPANAEGKRTSGEAPADACRAENHHATSQSGPAMQGRIRSTLDLCRGGRGSNAATSLVRTRTPQRHRASQGRRGNPRRPSGPRRPKPTGLVAISGAVQTCDRCVSVNGSQPAMGVCYPASTVNL